MSKKKHEWTRKGVTASMAVVLAFGMVPAVPGVALAENVGEGISGDFAQATEDVGNNVSAKSVSSAEELAKEVANASNGTTVLELSSDVAIQSYSGAINGACIALSNSNSEADVVVDGKGNTIYLSSNASLMNAASLLGIHDFAGSITIKNLNIVSSPSVTNAKHCLNVYNSSNVKLVGIELTNSKEAGLVIGTNSHVDANGLTTLGNTWGAVNVDKNSSFSMSSGSLSENVQVWTEQQNSSITMPKEYVCAIGGTSNDDALKGFTYYSSDLSKLGSFEIRSSNETPHVFNSLGQALSNAATGSTIKLLKDTEVTNEEEFVISRELNFDLCGKELTLHRPLKVTAGGDLVVLDSTAIEPPIVSADYESVTYGSGCIHNIENAAPWGNCHTIVVSNGGKVRLESGKICSEGNCGIYVNGNMAPESEADNAKPVASSLTVNGGYIEALEFGAAAGGRGALLDINGGVIVARNNAAVAGNGTNSIEAYYGGTTIDISGGTIISHSTHPEYIACGVYHPQRGDLRISGGTIFADGGVGILMRGGSMSMSGGRVISTGSSSGKVGDSKIVSNCYGVQADGESKYYDHSNISVSISGGSVSSAAEVPVLNVVDSDSGTMSVIGGSFSGKVTEYLGSGYVLKAEEDGSFNAVAKSGLTAGVYYLQGGEAILESDLASGYAVEKGEDGAWIVSKLTIPGGGSTAPSEPEGEVTENPDGSTTTTVTEEKENADGSTTTTVTETTEGREDGSVTEKVTETTVSEDGAKTEKVTETNTLEDGTSATTVTVDGELASVEATVTEEAVEAAAGKAVELPMAPVEAASSDKAVEIEVEAPAGAKVAVPVAKAEGASSVAPGAVLVLVDAEGNETVLPKTANDGSSLSAEVPGDCSLKVVDASADFPDVDADDWYAKQGVADFVSARGIMTGVETEAGAEFQGGAPTNRGMFVTMLNRLEMEAKASSGEGFADVPEGSWYAGSSAWAVEAGIATGYENADGTFAFDGDGEVTREQMATFLFRYAQWLKMDTSARAERDIEGVSGFAEEAVSWAVAEGLIQGDDETGAIRPTDGATRAEAAVVVMRMIGLMA